MPHNYRLKLTARLFLAGRPQLNLSVRRLIMGRIVTIRLNGSPLIPVVLCAFFFAIAVGCAHQEVIKEKKYTNDKRDRNGAPVECNRIFEPEQAGSYYKVTLEPLQMPKALEDNLSVFLLNQQSDNSYHFVINEFRAARGPMDLLFSEDIIVCADYRGWTDHLISYWTAELKKLGAFVDASSSNKIGVKVDNVVYINNPFQSFWLRAHCNVKLSSFDNSWRKEYRESATSGWNAFDAYNKLFRAVVEKMMSDSEVLERMKSRKDIGQSVDN